MKPTCIYIYPYPMSFTSMIGSCILLYYRTPVESSDCLSLARDRKYITVLSSLGIYKMVERKMVTEQGYGLGIGGCKRLCPATNGT